MWLLCDNVAIFFYILLHHKLFNTKVYGSNHRSQGPVPAAHAAHRQHSADRRETLTHPDLPRQHRVHPAHEDLQAHRPDMARRKTHRLLSGRRQNLLQTHRRRKTPPIQLHQIQPLNPKPLNPKP